MKLIVRNDLGEEFNYTCQEFEGYDVFTEAMTIWNNDWSSYMVLDGDKVLENVINPASLDVANAVSIH